MTQSQLAVSSAAYNMAHSQLTPQGIHDPALIGALCSVPWEALLEPSFACLSYSDAAVPCGRGIMLPPTEIGKTLSLLTPAPNKRLLCIGAGTGAEACAAASLFGEVTVTDTDEKLLRSVSAFLPSSVLFRPCSPLEGDLRQEEPYDALLVNSARPLSVPPALPQGLIADGGVAVYFTLLRSTGLLTAWKAVKTSRTPPVFYPDFQYVINPDMI